MKDLKAAFHSAFLHTIPMLTSVTVLGMSYGRLMLLTIHMILNRFTLIANDVEITPNRLDQSKKSHI